MEWSAEEWSKMLNFEVESDGVECTGVDWKGVQQNGVRELETFFPLNFHQSFALSRKQVSDCVARPATLTARSRSMTVAVTYHM